MTDACCVLQTNTSILIHVAAYTIARWHPVLRAADRMLFECSQGVLCMEHMSAKLVGGICHAGVLLCSGVCVLEGGAGGKGLRLAGAFDICGGENMK